MKRLILMRHAKSSWDSGALSDHERPLNDRGRRDAPRMGGALNQRGWIPDRIVSSDAERTRQTWDGLSQTLFESDDAPEAQFVRSLYGGGFNDIARACSNFDDDVTCALVLGHNPGWEDTASALCGVRITMTTANCVLLSADGSWDELMEPGAWSLVEVLRPREL